MALQPVSSSPDVWDRLWSLLYANDYSQVAYVYRINAMGMAQKPHLCKLEASSDLPDVLRDHFGGGEFKILIRKGRMMTFSGTISIGPPHRPVLG